jgi:hypothetical protein
MNMTWEEESYRLFVRLLVVRSYVRFSEWIKENDNVKIKSDDEGKKEQK